jgi:hypothetical protein
MTALSQDNQYTKCAGKNCLNVARRTIKIRHINKVGDFCDSCVEDLLREGLATMIGEIMHGAN